MVNKTIKETSMDLELSGKVVLITGGSKGIGLACAHAFAREGAKVAIASRSADNLAAARAELEQAGHQIYIHAANLSDAEAAQQLVDAVEHKVGPIAVPGNSAGGSKGFEDGRVSWRVRVG